MSDNRDPAEPALRLKAAEGRVSELEGRLRDIRDAIGRTPESPDPADLGVLDETLRHVEAIVYGAFEAAAFDSFAAGDPQEPTP